MRIASATLATLPAVGVWVAVRWSLGQTESHGVDIGSVGSVFEHGITMLRGIDRNTNLDFVGLPLLALCGWAMVRQDRDQLTPPGCGATALLLVLLTALALVALFSLTPVTDDPRKRFALFVTLTIGTLGIVDLRESLPRRWFLVIAMLLLLQPSIRVAKHAVKGRGPVEPDYGREALARFVPSNALISLDHVGAAPQSIGERVLVSPP